jgi:hypothetical protein
LIQEVPMSNPTYFVQECPTCGRSLQVRVEHLGRKVVCQHCKGLLVAADPAMRSDSGEYKKTMLRRADELLAAASREKNPSRSHHPR